MKKMELINSNLVKEKKYTLKVMQPILLIMFILDELIFIVLVAFYLEKLEKEKFLEKEDLH